MKIRKVFAFILSQVLCLFSISTVSLSTFADDAVDFEKVYVSAVVNGKNQNLSAINTKDGNIFFSGKTLSDVTVYNNNTSDSLFEHDKVDPKNKYRSIKIDKSIKKAHLLSFGLGEPIIQKSVELPDIIEFENEVYYPIAEMLPILNANAAVSDNKLYIEDVPYSLSNIMPEFNISNYMFDIYGTDTKILSGYSYLFNGLLDFELKKFVPIVGTRINKIETYEEIFTSYLAEDEAYFEAIGDEEHYELPMIKYLLDDDSERINTVIEGMGAANDIIKDYSGYDISTEDLKMIKSSAALGEQLDYAIKLYSFAAIYTDHVTDHYEMLDAIYEFEATNRKNKNKIIVLNEESFAGADKIYKMYTDDQKKAIANYIGKQIENKVKDLIEDGIKDGISNELSLGHAFAWSKLAASVMKAYFIATDFYVYNVSRKCENLPYYNKLMERGASKFWAYNNAQDNISKDKIEKTRLSAIFTLLSSRSMYQALCDSEKALDNSGAIYQKKIDAINEVLKKLYLAKNCCLTDSGEYIDERISELESEINNIKLNNEPFSDNLNITAKVSDKIGIHDDDGEPLYQSPSFDSPKLAVIPFDSTVTILSVPDNYQSENSNGYFALVDYNSQTGYISTKSLLCNPAIDTSLYSEKQIWDMGKILFQEYDTLTWAFTRGTGLLDCVGTGEYQGDDFQKLSPAGLTIEDLQKDFYTYFSKTVKGYFENLFREKDGFLWHVTGWGDAIWLDRYEVTRVKSHTDDEIIFVVEEYIDPNFYEFYPEKVYPFEFRIVKEDGNWLFTIPDDQYSFSSAQDNSEEVSSDAYAIVGTVNTKGDDLNLRSSPFVDSTDNTITKIPNNSSVTILLPILENNSDSNKEWYLIEYNHQIGYASAKYIQSSNSHVSFTEAQVLAVAKRLFYEAVAADVWNYATCFSFDRSNTVQLEENYSGRMVDCYILSGIKERSDFFNAIHKSFSKKYDQERVPNPRGDGFIGLGGLVNEYGELDLRYYSYCFDDTITHQFYLVTSNFAKGDMLLSAISEPPYSTIQIDSNDYNDTEIYFTGTLDFTKDAVIRETLRSVGYDYLPVNNFSICFEDGRWKVGQFIPPQY